MANTSKPLLPNHLERVAEIKNSLDYWIPRLRSGVTSPTGAAMGFSAWAEHDAISFAVALAEWLREDAAKGSKE